MKYSRIYAHIPRGDITVAPYNSTKILVVLKDFPRPRHPYALDFFSMRLMIQNRSCKVISSPFHCSSSWGSYGYHQFITVKLLKSASI